MDAHAELADLQNRFHLLEGDRKAFYEQSQLTLKQNKEVCDTLRFENKDLRMALGGLSKERSGGGESNAMLDAESDKIEVRLALLRKRQNQLQDANRTKDRSMNTLDDELRDLQRSSSRPAHEANPLMRQIRTLENRLDKAMIKYNEAQSIRKTYEQIVKRLKEEGTGFDNQLSGIERTLKAKERDYEELLLLSHDAYHAKEMAQAELHRFEQGVMEERNQRDKEVQDKKMLVQQRVEMNQRLEQRERMLKKQQDAERAGDRQIKEISGSVDMTSGVSNDIALEEQQKISDYQEAFHKIKESTGVSDVNEVIQKFLTQEDTHKNLTSLTRENQAKVESLSLERRKMRLQVEDLKFSSGGNVGRRQVIDDFENHITEAGERYERSRVKFERLAKMLIDMKAGIAHLGEKLTIINLEGGEAPVEMSDETVEEVLQQCELKLSKLLSLTSEVDDSDGRGRAIAIDDDKYEEKLLAKSASDVRVKLNDQEQDADDDDDDFEEELDEDVWNRKHVKYNSEQIMERQVTKLRKKGKKKGEKHEAH
jgi:hypothetical protein